MFEKGRIRDDLGAKAENLKIVSEAMWADVNEPVQGTVRIGGRGPRGLVPPEAAIDCGNAGTVLRTADACGAASILRALCPTPGSSTSRQLKRQPRSCAKVFAALNTFTPRW